MIKQLFTALAAVSTLVLMNACAFSQGARPEAG
jgi:hypothetical protein